MRVRLFDFNHPVDTCIEAGVFHAHARDETGETDTSPIGNMVIGINPKSHTVDTVALVIDSYQNWSFRQEDRTVLKLDFSRLNEPIPLTPMIIKSIENELGIPKFVRCPQDIVCVSETLGLNILKLVAQGCCYQTTARAARLKLLSDHLAEIRELLGRDDLPSDAKFELLLARDCQGKFGDTVWSRDIVHPLDREGVMGNELRVVHIRPWDQSTDTQRVDPDNGLLLPMEVADAFENGYVTFNAEGRIVVSGYMMRKLWNLEGSTSDFCRTLEMNRGQHLHMHFHRENIYEKWLRQAA